MLLSVSLQYLYLWEISKFIFPEGKNWLMNFSFTSVMCRPGFLIRLLCRFHSISLNVFLFSIVFVLYILFGLVEVGDASKSVLVAICKIVTVKVDCDWSRLYMVLFWGCDICIYEFVGY